MSSRARQWMIWVVAALAVAVVVHIVAIHALPRVIMSRVLSRMGPPNTVHVGNRPTAASRGVVRPSPDLLYASCVYDLSKGPVRITAPVLHSTYWSVSAFDDDTNNFFVENDHQIAENSLRLLLVRKGDALLHDSPDQTVLVSPSEKGLILFRVLIDADGHLPGFRAALQQARCEMAAPGPAS